MTNSMQQTRAVCCQCGNPRTVSVHWHRRTHRRARDLRDDMDGIRRYPGADKYWRFFCRAKCPHCAKITPPQAILRDHNPHWDVAENRNHDSHTVSSVRTWALISCTTARGRPSRWPSSRWRRASGSQVSRSSRPVRGDRWTTVRSTDSWRVSPRSARLGARE
jgi:hypothetical protein